MKDFLGKDLKVGDTVVFILQGYRELKKGKVVRASKTQKTIYISHKRYRGSDSLYEIKQTPDQVIVIPDEEI